MTIDANDQVGSDKIDPQHMALRAQPRPVTRLNRRLLIAIAATLSVGLAAAVMWSLQPPKAKSQAPAAELYNVEQVERVEQMEQLPKDYSGVVLPPSPPPKLGPPLPGDLGPAIVQAQQRQGIDPTSQTTAVEALERQREAEAAANSPVVFARTSKPASSEPAVATPTAAGDTLESSRPFDAIAKSNGSSGFVDPTAEQNQQERKQASTQQSWDASTRNRSDLQPPASPHQVMAGTVIPAALLTGINSDLPGQVIATVTEPVRDTATGRHTLIPQGSRLIGRYDSQVAYGQRRVLLVWLRLILPDTSSIALDRLPGVDPAGYAGLEDGVDWHWDRILAGAVLSTLIGVGAELAAPENRTDGDRVVVAARNGVQESVNQVGQEVTRRNVNIQPTLTVRPGFALRVMVTKDLVLRPYQPLFFERGKQQ